VPVISTRFVGHTILLLSLALVPTTIHSYLRLPLPAGLRMQELAIAPAGQTGEPTARTDAWAARRFATDDWIQRSYYGGAVTLTMVRSFDAKRLYHHPELAVAYPDDYAPATVSRLPQKPEIPVHILSGQNASQNIRSLYALLYDGRYVDNPIAFQLRTSIELLVSRRKPMTLLFVREAGIQNTDPVAQSRGAQALVAAMQSVSGQARPD
jgi:hypothetical protein